MQVTIKPVYLAIVALFVAGVLVVVAVAEPSSDENGAEPQSVAAIVQTATPSPATLTPAPEATPSAPDPTATPVVRSCEVILESGVYASQAEKQFYLGNCLRDVEPTTVAVSGNGSPPVIVPPAPPADINGRIDFIGAIWAAASIPVTYCVNPANPPIGSSGDPILSPDHLVALVQEAFQTWESIPQSSITFAYQGLCPSDPWDRSDGVNTVGWGWLFGSAAGVASWNATHGEFLRQDSFGQFYEMDIIVDVRYPQSLDDPSNYLSRELQHILLHEVGHLIGLGHATEPCSVMGPSGIGSGLCWVDVAAAATLYPN